MRFESAGGAKDFFRRSLNRSPVQLAPADRFAGEATPLMHQGDTDARSTLGIYEKIPAVSPASAAFISYVPVAPGAVDPDES